MTACKYVALFLYMQIARHVPPAPVLVWDCVTLKQGLSGAVTSIRMESVKQAAPMEEWLLLSLIVVSLDVLTS